VTLAITAAVSNLVPQNANPAWVLTVAGGSSIQVNPGTHTSFQVRVTLEAVHNRRP